MSEGEQTASARWWWAGFAAIAAVAVGMTALAYQERVPELLRAYDKETHFVFAGSLAFFLDGALRRRMLALGGAAVPAASVLLLVPIGIEEYLQRYATFRTSSLADFGADVAGVIAFTWLSRRVTRASEPHLADARDDRAK